jgi:SNF related kinase
MSACTLTLSPAHVFCVISQAIAYCHQLHVVHRDLKPQNIVYFVAADVVKVCDFGLGRPYLPGYPLHTPCGSLAFSAPEMLLADAYEPPAVGKSISRGRNRFDGSNLFEPET